MAKNGSTLKEHIKRQVMIVEGKSVPADLAEQTREWLAQKGILDIIVAAIKGNEIDGEKLKLKDRVNFALKLSNKLLPDLKSSEMKKTETHDINVRHTATQDLLDEAGIYGGAPVKGNVIEVEASERR